MAQPPIKKGSDLASVIVSACWMSFPILGEGRCRGSGWHIVASGLGEHAGAQVDQIGRDYSGRRPAAAQHCRAD
jgi:hypothetical protein